MYEFVTGPFLWISFLLFLGGSIYKIVTMLKLAKKEKVIYPYMNLKFSLRSLAHWLVPFGSRNMRLRPLTTVITFSFHICLIFLPLFLLAHNVFWEKGWGIHWWTLPETWADAMTIVVLIGSLFFLMRRLILPEVKYVTTTGDYSLLILIILTFLTGFIAHHQYFWYNFIVTIHILCGELMLICIPFTRLSHMLYFFFTRAYMGCEFGNVRHARDW